MRQNFKHTLMLILKYTITNTYRMKLIQLIYMGIFVLFPKIILFISDFKN